ncbi:hypothetical protein ONA91_19240 [Micromonospora sp. DR5-3]|uniref:hypothetical protein n=1 Tax=unclassified Micromonospora TaxID=2617518 RepID=UPI0011D749B4|nr:MULTISPECIES: hypothetical protein [unclassified Micromonospora]MCW3816584.1 hypothetical protein [Micromonospora sp. DR5-3]TYC20226.1 hypothetical protein FXF52_32440 [Micromonospora sp. MP36]
MSIPDSFVPPPAAPNDGATDPSSTGGPGRPARSGAGLLAVAVAGVALVLALVSALLSWRAADRANEALDKLSAVASPAGVGAAPSQPPTSGPPAAEQTTDAPAPTESGAVPELNKQTRYEVRYTAQTLRVPAGSGCSDSVYIDLDEPRVQTESGVAELEFRRPCGTGSPYFNLTSDDVDAGEVSSDKVTPYDCADQIRTSPIAGEEQALRSGQVYCITTSIEAARSSANTWKLVLLSVTATPKDGSVTFTASAWNIPA